MVIKLQSGQQGERMAENWFLSNQWCMFRSQPPITILGIVTPGMVSALKRFIPRIASFGYMIIGRMGKGGISDYLGYDAKSQRHEFRACEVKECVGDSMPASRLSKEQRLFMSRLPEGCAWVGIFFKDTQKFKIFPFVDKGSYRAENNN